MKFPLVTIGVPFFNNSRIFFCIEKLLKQTYSNLEIIIVNNNSDEILSKKLENYIKNKKIKYFKNKINYGSIYSHNKLLDLANGKYFMWLHSDDWISENYIEECLKYLEQNQTFIAATGKFVHFFDDITMPNLIYNQPSNLKENLYERIKNFIKTDYPNSLIYALLRKEKIKKIKNYLAPEIPFLFNLLKEGKICGVSNIHYYKRNYIAKRNISKLRKIYNTTQNIKRYEWFFDCLKIILSSNEKLYKKKFLVFYFCLYYLPISRIFFRKKSILK